MKQTGLSTLTASINLGMFIFYLSAHAAYSDDPKYVACAAKNCGNQSIGFPFRITDRQEPYCGFPGFDLICHNDAPILNISENYYFVQQIFYNNRSIRVANAAAFDKEVAEGGCWPEIRNLSLTEHKFELPGTVSMLLLFSNCSTWPDGLERYKIRFCGAGNIEGLAMLDDNGDWGYAMGACGTEVVAPVELDRGDGIEYGNNLLGVMKKGFLLTWKATDCSQCEKSGGRCGFDSSSLFFQCFCPDRPHRTSCKPGRTPRRLILAIAVPVAVVVVIFFICVIVFLFIRKPMPFGSIAFWKKNEVESYQNVETFLKNYGSLAPKRYTYMDIKKMTNYFRTKLGQGGYGSVYKGQLPDSTLVAVKVLTGSKGNGEEFINEVASISRTSHVNVVTLIGFCFQGSKRSLVYEFMPNGSLEKFICDKNPIANHRLGWETLFRIAIGIARGLEYLHRGCNTRILHFDIKPHNILLDADFCPKISDFGLAKLCLEKESRVSLTCAKGTIGYIAPEVFCRNFGGISHKSDVYSYGMMVLEMVGGTKNINVGVDDTSEIYFPHWIYKRLEMGKEVGLHGIVDDEEANQNVRKMTIVGLWCILTDPTQRPSMSQVVEMLEGSLNSLHVPPKPFLSSFPSREEAHSFSTLTS